MIATGFAYSLTNLRGEDMIAETSGSLATGALTHRAASDVRRSRATAGRAVEHNPNRLSPEAKVPKFGSLRYKRIVEYADDVEPKNYVNGGQISIVSRLSQEPPWVVEAVLHAERVYQTRVASAAAVGATYLRNLVEEAKRSAGADIFSPFVAEGLTEDVA